MWGRIVAGAAGLMAFALAAFLGHQLIVGYGDARHAAGQAEAAAAQLPAIVAAHDAAANAKIAARERVIAADDIRTSEIARLLPLILSANDKVNTYAQSDAGRAPCLAADRVRDIAADRALLFPAAPEAGAGKSRPMPTKPAPDAAGLQPEQRR